MEKFVCDIYSKAHLSSFGDARYSSFKEKYAPAKGSDPLAKIKGADASTLPPSRAVLVQKVKRTNYVAMIWKNAHLQDPVSNSTTDPTESGWQLIDGKFKMVWFLGDQMPEDVGKLMLTADEVTPTDDDDLDEYSGSFDSDESDYEIDDD